MKKQLAAIATAFVALLFTGTLHAQVPQLLNYQGRVVVGTANFDGSGLFKFALVNAAATTTFWSNSPDTTPADGVPDSAVALTVTKGLYSVLLGDTSVTNMAAIPASVWTNADVRLRVWFNDGTNGSQLLTPDQRIAPSAYVSDGAVTSAKIASGAVTNVQLATNAVQSANIAAGAVDGTKIANVAITSGNLANGSVTAAKLGSDVGLWSATGLDVYRNIGNVGIGTTAPQWKLHVLGEAMVDLSYKNSARLVFGGNPNDNRFYIQGHNAANTDSADSLNFTGYNASNIPRINMLANTTFFNGSVGINTTTPGRTLEVAGNVGIKVNADAGGDAQIAFAQGGADKAYLTYWNSHGTLALTSGVGNDGIQFKLATRNVGIGTPDPQVKLHVLGDALIDLSLYNSARLVFTANRDDNNFHIQAHNVAGTDSADSLNLSGYSDHNIPRINMLASTSWFNGSVGIGGNGGNPAATLDVAGTVNVSSTLSVYENAWIAAGRALFGGGRLHIQSGTAPGEDLYLNPYGGKVFVGGGGGPGNLQVFGTTTTAVLEITGGGDVAEPFSVSHPGKPEPGMVMAIDREHPGELCVATSAYARTVAGIISGANGVNPGLTLRQQGTAADGTYPVALSGRVYCWCDASYGEIQPGDLLTTSDTAGHAMVATDFTRAPGATIGKAMTGLKEGKGLVLVLVTLQ